MAAAYDWSGFYLGINGGGGSAHPARTCCSRWAEAWRKGCHDATAAPSAARSVIAGNRPVGCSASKARANWADFSGSNTTPVGGNPIGGALDRTRIEAFGLITGQVGYTWNNVLAYVKERCCRRQRQV